MIRKITFLFLTVFCMFSARAGFIPVTVTGFNKDIVASGTGPVRSSTTSSVDDIRDTSGYVFLDSTYRSPGVTTAPTNYLPLNGQINSVATAGLRYQLAGYGGNNTLKLDTLNSTGTLTFQTPLTVSDIYILATAGAANVTGTTALVTFTDGTTQSFTIATINDWYSATGTVAVANVGRVNLSNGVAEGGTTGPRLYEYRLTLATGNYSKPVASVKFTKTIAAGFAQIMGISVNTISPCGPPVSQPSNLVLTPTVYGVNGSFTASVPPANKYMVLRSAGSSPADTPPTDGVVYTAGQTLGNATIISVAASTTFTDPGLTIGATYTYTILGFSDSTCYGISPAYNIVNPIIGSTTIPSCSATPAGTYTVGPTGTYPTLQAAMTALNNAAGAAGNILIELQSTYTSASETYPIVIPNISTSPCAIGNPTLTIRPAAGATGLIITGKTATPILDFNYAQRVILDGRPGGAGTTSQLTIINDSTAGVAIRLYNDASRNSIKFCDIQGRNSSNTSGTGLSGVVYFGQANATALNGNDYDTIANCSIHGTVNGQPAIGISAYGLNTRRANYNDSCTIANCNIYDFFNTSTASTGVKLDLGNNAWTINANNLYQTAARTYTVGATHRGLWITPNVSANDSTAGNFLITNNFIGGSAPAAGGTAFTLASSVATVFNGMDLSVGNGTATSVQNNVVTNISLSSTSTSTTGVFAGINTANGNINIGTLVGNTIGSGTGTGAIAVTSGISGTSFGIRIGGGSTINVYGNTVGSISLSGTTAATSVNFVGVGTGTSGSATTPTVFGNVVGSLITPNSISLAASTATTSQTVTGINFTGGSTINVVNNTIANLTNNHAATTATTTASQVRGIAASAGVVTITGNIIRSLVNSSIQTGVGASSAVLGISMTSTTANSNVAGNTIVAIRSTNATAAVNVVGLYAGSATTGNNLISKNLIHSLNAATTATGAFITGIDIGAGALTVSNNMIRVGIDSAGASITTPLTVRGITRGGTATASKFYFNSVYVGGNDVATSGTTATYAFQRGAAPAAGTDSVLNNIFVNARSNAGTGGGKHYAIYLASNANAGVNHNLYYTPGTGGIFGYNGTADVNTFATSWVAGDTRSISGDPKFVNPTGTAVTTNLHINTAVPTPVEGAGVAIPGVPDDYDSEIRSTLTPTDIGADAGNFTAQDISAPFVTYNNLDYTCLTTNRTFTATITDATGIPLTGTLVPRVYYRKGAAGTWVSTAGTLVSGTATNSVWSFTINVSLIGGTAAGDQVFYYVIAQDVVSPPNISATPAAGLVATDVNTVTTHPTSPTTYNVASGPLPAAVTITASAAAYCPVNGAVKLKATGGTIAGNLVAGTQAAQNATTGYPSPFSNYYGGSRHQFLVLASELTTAGFAAGTPFTSLNFPVVSIGSSFTNNQNFKVKITGTTLTALTGFVSNASTTTVFGPATFTPTVGYNNLIAFSTPYVWNGTDNIILETTFSNQNTGTTTDAVVMYNSPTSFNSNVVYRTDGSTAAAVEAATTISIGPNTARPDFTLRGSLVAPFTWSPTTGLYTNAAATTPYTGGQADSVYATPATTTVYTVTATTPQGCSTTQTISLSNNCTVPVTLLSFTGERRNAVNLLSCTTATELNSKGFELQRSADGINFSAFSFVNSKAINGSSNSQLTYTFTDANALKGNSYYRLKQIDRDGKFAYSNIVLLKGDKVNALTLSVLYPNPAKDKLNIIIASPKAENLTLIVSDVTGKIVHQQKVAAVTGDNKYEVNVGMLTSGNYVIKAICDDGCETVISRFVKQ